MNKTEIFAAIHFYFDIYIIPYSVDLVLSNK